MRFLGLLLSVMVGGLLAAALLVWFAAGEIYDYSDSFDLSKDAKEIEVVVVLAGGKGRIPLAVDLWKKIRSAHSGRTGPVLFLSGLGRNTGMDALPGQGVSSEDFKLFTKENLVFENVSENTYENAQLFASFARQKGWRQVVLVTASYHMRRAEFIFKRVLDPEVKVRTETLDAGHFGRNEWRRDGYSIRVTVIEYFKWLYYRYSY
jgi:uncharacterized SAM-binding protein YcdF (DUF218 family)